MLLTHLVNQTDPVAGGQGGVWRIGADGTTPLARVQTTGNLGPRLGDDTVFTSFDRILADRPGDIFAVARLENDTTGFTGAGLLRLDPAANTLLARTGTDGALGPQLGSGVQFDFFLGSPQMAGDGRMLAVATITDGSTDTTRPRGLWFVTETGITPIALEGTDGPLGPNLGSGVVFGDPASPNWVG